jgi:hypothetical protein
MSQLSLFGAGMTDPSLDDLEGLLAGPGSLERRGDAARLTVPANDDWRAEVLLRGFAGLHAGGEVVHLPGHGDNRLHVRTDFLTGLYQLALRWHSPLGKHAPSGHAGLRLDGARLWWWCVAGGTSEAAGYRLQLGAQDGDAVWSAAGAALAAAGVPGVLVGQRSASADGPAYRVVGIRRLVRLVELVGAAPAGVPPGAWPAAERAHAGMAGAPLSGNFGDPRPS